ncbi:NAD(P)/FAD-dependent oxidoreductase [Demequina salsinemoris]|uniref:NAD(P)/FAD-dependent oxidoreductase n=1 Tax=Demequina salsinemoris TaxID=577470 RepID=UPI0007855B05|nr:FAD-dependent oxidoreductase [Demequina salsinemoris]
MRIVVVGAGVVGLATAYRLVKDGHDVTVLEADTYGMGPSHGNAALVTDVLSFPVPAPGTMLMAAKSFLDKHGPISITPRVDPGYLTFLARMGLATRTSAFHAGTRAQDVLSQMTMPLYDQYVADGLVFEQHRGGSMHAFESREELDEALKVFEPFPQLASRIRPLVGADEVAEVDPGVSPAYAYGYVAPDDRQVEPVSLMDAIVASLRASGVEIFEHSPVVGFATRGGEVAAVVTPTSVLECDAVVLAAGVASRDLAKRLGARLPLYSGGGYSVDVEVEADLRPRTSVLTGRTHIAVTPLDKGVRASSGMIMGQRRPEVAEATVERLLADLHHLYPDVPLDKRAAGWAGLRPMSADGVPIIGMLPGTTNAVVATGHAMLGLTYAPATAEVVAAHIGELAGGDEVPERFGVLAPSRFRTMPGRRTD